LRPKRSSQQRFRLTSTALNGVQCCADKTKSCFGEIAPSPSTPRSAPSCATETPAMWSARLFPERMLQRCGAIVVEIHSRHTLCCVVHWESHAAAFKPNRSCWRRGGLFRAYRSEGEKIEEMIGKTRRRCAKRPPLLHHHCDALSGAIHLGCFHFVRDIFSRAKSLTWHQGQRQKMLGAMQAQPQRKGPSAFERWIQVCLSLIMSSGRLLDDRSHSPSRPCPPGALLVGPHFTFHFGRR